MTTTLADRPTVSIAGAAADVPQGHPAQGIGVPLGAAPASRPDAGRSRLPSVPLVGAVVSFFAVLMLALVGFVLVGSAVAHQRDQEVMLDTLGEQLKTATAPVTAPFVPGAPIGVIDSPKLGDAMVFVAGAGSAQLAKGPGLRSDSVMPGQPGVAVIQGRRSAYGGPFERLDRFAPGDTIKVTSGIGEFTYVVDLVRYSDQEVPAPPVVASRLTLLTSDGHYSPTRTLIVSGALANGVTPAAPGSGLPAAPASEAPLALDPGAALPLFLWSQALLVVAVAMAYLWHRIPSTTLWLGASPLLLVLLWQVSASIVQLLPNTL